MHANRNIAMVRKEAPLLEPRVEMRDGDACRLVMRCDGDSRTEINDFVGNRTKVA
jgi:hypothetical protein